MKRIILVAGLFSSLLQMAAAQDNWPSFRGPSASGVSDGARLPESWDGVVGRNIRWKTRINGLAHSSPVFWGDAVFVTTAVSSRGDHNFKHGLYGAGTASQDRSEQSWLVYRLDRQSGRVLWERTAHRGLPRSRRHIKATYANATPALDGRHVVVSFGSEGLYCYDFEGNLLWKKDLGILNVGAYNAPGYEWGPASSPIIYRGLVIVQCDTQGKSFLLAADIESGETRWRVSRDELPSWGTPNVFEGVRAELISNASNFIRGYDPLTGRELWKLGGSSKITAPTPVFNDDLIVVASGRRPVKPLFAIRPGAAGNITLEDGQESSEAVAWSRRGRGSYMPTPLIYGKYLYVLANHGVLDCYEIENGREVYRRRIPHVGGGFSASPVASDQHIYLAGEDGEVFVLKAGPRFELISSNPMGELLMATPALGEETLLVRGKDHLFSVGGPVDESRR